MKNLLALMFFITSVLYSQTKVKTDSIAYYTNQANSSINKNKYNDALSFTQKAINFAAVNDNKKNQALQTFHLGKIYYDLSKYDDARESFTESISLLQGLDPSVLEANIYYYLSLTSIGVKDYKTAEATLNGALSLYSKLKIQPNEDVINLQKGIIYKAKGNYNSAALYFSYVIAKPDSTDAFHVKPEALYQIGLIEQMNKRNNLAINYFNKALILNAKNQNLQQKSNILLALSSVYDSILDKRNAYSFLQLHLNLERSLQITNNEKLGIDDFENFKQSQILQKLEILNNQNAEKAKTNKFYRLINILAIALISILSLLSLSLYKNNIIRNKSNLLLKEKNNELIVEKEKTEKASHARSEFLSTVSHELRTPLNAINGITHLLLVENPKKSQLHYLSSLKFSANYLATFINEILEINRIDSNKIEIEYVPFNLKELLEDIKNSLKGLAFSNNNIFILNIDPNIPNNLIGDPTKLSQIFMNLINNALKFTKDGSVTITAKVAQLDTGYTILSFQIIDTGIGISEDKLEFVFESFSQGSVEINRKYGGTGLGLAIVKKLIEILGGNIKLQSLLGQGSTFFFDLRFKVEESQLPKVAAAPTYDDAALKNKKILIVEDNKINQMITKKMLQNKGVICEIIDNGEEAVESVRNSIYDMVLMDVHLPGINGTVATEKIRKFNPHIPIIAITAISLNENREMLLSFGMNDVVTKPFAPSDFYAVIINNLS